MHIPDGYLSPQTCGIMGAAMIPVWTIASRKASRVFERKSVPLMALGAAFSFMIMMFNVPIPGGTTAHAVGATLLAIAIGPWAAGIAITITLAIQALIFGDGGILSLGANCFNMAFLAPFAGYVIFKAVSALKANQVIAAVIGSYIGINIAALAAAIEFGLQPLLFHTANGTPLYCPYGLNLAIPAMMTAHLTIAGPVEALVTGLAVYYLQKVKAENILYTATARIRGIAQ
jgi:cobalt/nickel transport system permease protein